jgi:hypothetical protein
MNREDLNHVFQHMQGSVLQLEKCPFCGDKAEIEKTAYNRYTVNCTGCPAELSGSVQGNIYSAQDHVKCINVIVSDWNKRVRL